MLHRLKALLFGRGKDPRPPDDTRIYAVGDVHGRLDLLEILLQRVEEDVARRATKQVIYVFLGDYVDRGPMSGHVIERLIDHSRDHFTICLKGNHETYLMDFLNHPHFLDEWIRAGALPTLISYGLAPSLKPQAEERIELSMALNAALPGAHKTFLASLSPAFTCGDFFFVHAGVRPGVPLAAQSEEDLINIRKEFLMYRRSFEKFIVHGHTPVREPDLRFNRLNIDTGAYATGRLTCVSLDTDGIKFI